MRKISDLFFPNLNFFRFVSFRFFFSNFFPRTYRFFFLKFILFRLVSSQTCFSSDLCFCKILFFQGCFFSDSVFSDLYLEFSYFSDGCFFSNVVRAELNYYTYIYLSFSIGSTSEKGVNYSRYAYFLPQKYYILTKNDSITDNCRGRGRRRPPPRLAFAG